MSTAATRLWTAAKTQDCAILWHRGPFAALLWKEWRQHRGTFFGAMLFIPLLLLMGWSIAALRQHMNWGGFDWPVYLAVFMGVFTFLLPMFVCIPAATERAGGHFQLILCRPIRPVKILLARTLIGALIVLIPVLTLGLLATAMLSDQSLLAKFVTAKAPDAHANLLQGVAAIGVFAFIAFMWLLAFTSRSPSETWAVMSLMCVTFIWGVSLTVMLGAIEFMERLGWSLKEENWVMWHPLGMATLMVEAAKKSQEIRSGVWLPWALANMTVALGLWAIAAWNIGRPITERARWNSSAKSRGMRLWRRSPAVALAWKDHRQCRSALIVIFGGSAIVAACAVLMQAAAEGNSDLGARLAAASVGSLGAIVIGIFSLCAFTPGATAAGELQGTVYDFLRGRPISPLRWYLSRCTWQLATMAVAAIAAAVLYAYLYVVFVRLDAMKAPRFTHSSAFFLILNATYCLTVFAFSTMNAMRRGSHILGGGLAVGCVTLIFIAPVMLVQALDEFGLISLDSFVARFDDKTPGSDWAWIAADAAVSTAGLGLMCLFLYWGYRFLRRDWRA